MDVVEKWQILSLHLLAEQADEDERADVEHDGLSESDEGDDHADSLDTKPSLRAFMIALTAFYDSLDGSSTEQNNGLVRVLAVMASLGIRGKYATDLNTLARLDLIPIIVASVAEAAHDSIDEGLARDETMCSFASILYEVLGKVDAKLVSHI